MPPNILQSSDKLDSLLQNTISPADINNKGDSHKNQVLADLNLSAIDEIWPREAELHLSGRELLSKQEKLAFAGRLIQTEIFLRCHLPLLESYFSRGGKIEWLSLEHGGRYMSLMHPEPVFHCEWMRGGSVSLEHLLQFLCLTGRMAIQTKSPGSY